MRATGAEIVRRAGLACGLGAAAIAGTALAGWATGLRRLGSVRADYIPMAPNTGLALLALAAAVVAGVRGRARLAGVGGALVVALTGARLAEYATGLDLAVDRWFVRTPAGERFGLAPVGKMALFTALTLGASGLSALLMAVAPRSRRAGDLAGCLGLGASASGLVFVLGYLYAEPLLYGTQLIPMALNTAAASLLIGLGLVAAAGPRALPLRPLFGPTTRAELLRVFLPFAVGVVGVATWMTHLVSRYSGGSRAALLSAVALVAAAVLAALICGRIADRVGGRLERAEAALRRAHDELEARVVERTRELSLAKAEVERRNAELQRMTAELAETAASVCQAHQDLQKAHQDLQRAEAQLVQSEKLSALGQLVAGVAHEINNPLAFVSNNVAVLQRDVGHLHELLRLYQEAEGTLEQHQRELLARIRRLAEQIDLGYVLDNLDAMMVRSRDGLRRIQQIVKDLRNFARLDEADLKAVDLNEGIVSTVNIMRCQADARGVALEMELAPLPPIACYAAKVNQVILNLVSNAIDACRPGGRVLVRSRPAEGGAEIQVLDDGCGIDPAHLARIFDPFFTTKPVGQGTGLGLSISYGIVQAHGGRIEVDSAPGRGSCFAIYLPPTPPKPVAGARLGATG